MSNGACWAALIIVGGFVSACTVPETSLDGRPCPCLPGWQCVADVCVRDGEVPDARVDATDSNVPDSGVLETGAPDAPADAPVDTSPEASPDASTCAFYDDFTQDSLVGWQQTGGTWVARNGEAVLEEDTLSEAALWATATDGTVDFHARTSMRMISGPELHSAMEITFRLQTSATVNRFFCNWEPNSGTILIMRQESSGTVVLETLTIDTSMIAGYDPFAPVTMNVQVDSGRINCWVEEFPEARLSSNDATLTSGAIGLKAWKVSVAYDWFEVCTP